MPCDDGAVAREVPRTADVVDHCAVDAQEHWVFTGVQADARPIVVGRFPKDLGGEHDVLSPTLLAQDASREEARGPQYPNEVIDGSCMVNQRELFGANGAMGGILVDLKRVTMQPTQAKDLVEFRAPSAGPSDFGFSGVTIRRASLENPPGFVVSGTVYTGSAR